MVGGGWGPTFWFFNSLENNMEYSLGIYKYISKRNSCRTKVLWVLKFGEVFESWNPRAQKPIGSREQCAHKPIQQESSVLINQ